MNANKRSHKKLTIPGVVEIKLLLAHGVMPQKDIAELKHVAPDTISKIAKGKYWADVKIPVIELARPDPDRHMGGVVRYIPAISAGPCIVCGKIVLDGVDESVIYLVADDALLCCTACEAILLKANTFCDDD